MIDDQTRYIDSGVLADGREVTSLRVEIAAVLPSLKLQERRRYPVHRTSRTEGRDLIRTDDRLYVYQRDGFRCMWCNSDKQLTLDHILPWSAHGSDHVDNLRTLCWDCNEHRSNFRHIDDSWRPLPMTFFCDGCDPDGELGHPLNHPATAPVFCWWCRLPSTGIPGRWWDENPHLFWDYDLNWHREKPPGFTRDLWERWISHKKFPWTTEPVEVPWEHANLDLTCVRLVES